MGALFPLVERARLPSVLRAVHTGIGLRARKIFLASPGRRRDPGRATVDHAMVLVAQGRATPDSHRRGTWVDGARAPVGLAVIAAGRRADPVELPVDQEIPAQLCRLARI